MGRLSRALELARATDGAGGVDYTWCVATRPGIKNLEHVTLDELDLSEEERAAFFEELARDAAESRRDHGVADPD